MKHALVVGSILSRFVSPLSFPQTTVGSLVYPSYFLTNYSQTCSNRARFRAVDQFCHSFIQHGGCHEFLSATKCVLGRFHVGKFRPETQQDAVLNLLKGKDVLVSQPAASAKFIIFQSFPIIVGVVYR